MSELPDIEAEFHGHARALRNIARDLLRDAHAADDVTQDTMCAALSRGRHGRPDLAPGPLGGWLYRTVVNFARQWRRRERRHQMRQGRVPAPPGVATPAESLMRRETLLRVTQAVMALAEPYQTAIFLRYFENLPPRAIAARTGENLATVKSRLQRGIAMLRTRLAHSAGAERDDWRVGLLLTFGPPRWFAAMVLGSLATGSIMGTFSKFVVAAGVLCASGLFVYSLGQDPPPQNTSGAQGPQVSVGASVSSGEAAASSADREVLATTAAEPNLEAWLDHPYVLELEVFVVDAHGLPVEGRTVRLSPGNCTLNDAPIATGPDGKAMFNWHSRLPTGEIVLADEDGLLRRVVLQHGTLAKVTLGSRAKEGPTLWLSALGRIETRVAISSLSWDRNSLRDVPRDVMRIGLHPHAVFGARAVVPTAEHAISESTVGVAFTLAFSEDRIGLVTESTNEPRPPAALPRIAGSVFGADGVLAPGVPVVLMAAGHQPVARGRTGEDGRFEFADLQAGEFTVRAGGTARGLATASATTTTGTTPVTLNLQLGSCVRGRVQAVSGAPVADALIVWRASDGSWCDSTISQKDGTFVLANLPASGGTVMLWPSRGAEHLPVLVVRDVQNDNEDLLLQVADLAESALVVELPKSAEGTAVPYEVRVWNLDTGLGTTLPTPQEGMPWRLAKLACGWYRVEVFAPASGWQDLGRHWVDGKNPTDLGRAVLALPGTVELALGPTSDAPPPPPGTAELEICELRRDVDVRLELGVLERNATLQLPAGAYVLAFCDGTGATRFHRFAVRSGERVRVEPTR